MAAASATVPLPARAGAASALGAELARLEGTLAGRPLEIQDHHPERTQLPADQAAAVLPVLTHDKRVNRGGRVMGRLDRRELRQPRFHTRHGVSPTEFRRRQTPHRSIDGQTANA
jgi:hypothetical protein